MHVKKFKEGIQIRSLLKSDADVYSEQLLESQRLIRKGDNVPKYMLHTQRNGSGIFFGTKVMTRRGEKKFWQRRQNYFISNSYVSKPCWRDGHVLIIGGSGTGKSSCIVMPTLEAWNGTIFALDLKGELKARWEAIETGKYPAKTLNLTRETGDFASYDPFNLLREGGQADLIQNVRELALSIIPASRDMNDSDTFWVTAAQNILAGALLYYFSIGSEFNEALLAVQSKSLKCLCKKIDDSGMAEAKLFFSQFNDVDDASDSRIMEGVSAQLKDATMLFATDPTVRALLKPSDNMVTWEDLATNNIFLYTDESRLNQFGRVTSLILIQLIRSLERRPEKNSADGKKLPPLLLILDEFPRLGRCDPVIEALSTLRSRGVTICITTQSLAYLDLIYGMSARKVIIDNCQYKAVLGIGDADEQQYFSELVGTVPVLSKSFSTNRDPETGQLSGSSLHVGENREQIIFPCDFNNLQDVVLLTPEGFCRVNKLPFYRKLSCTQPITIRV